MISPCIVNVNIDKVYLFDGTISIIVLFLKIDFCNIFIYILQYKAIYLAYKISK